MAAGSPRDVLLPPRTWTSKALNAKRREMGSRAFEAQYQTGADIGGRYPPSGPEWFATIPPEIRKNDLRGNHPKLGPRGGAGRLQ